MGLTRQFTRFSVVGLTSNLLLYLLYLFLTQIGMGPKWAMTILYLLGVLMTFAFNRSWSFRHHGLVSAALFRYFCVYLLGYAVNWTILFLLVDHAGWPHRWVQAGMILLMAAALFLSQKYWVFNHAATE